MSPIRVITLMADWMFWLLRTELLIIAIGLSSWTWVLQLGWVTQAAAQTQSPDWPIVFSDDFSQGIDKWQAVRDDGTRWRVVDGMLRAEVIPAFTISELVPKDEYWSDQWQDIEYRVTITPQQGVDRNISFGWQDTRHWYEVHFNHNLFEVVQVKNNTVVWSSGRSFTMVNDQSYRLRIRFDDGLVQLWIDDTQVFSEHNNLHYQPGPGKVGLKTTTGAVFPTRVTFDDVEVRVKPLDTDFRLSVPLLKQTHHSWVNLEYDTASRWSNQPTIGRWGCALTSLVMVMQFYGLHTLPDGQLLTPASLNEWLKAQPDGYIGNGALNWLAGTRLTRLLSDTYFTPKLEYRRHHSFDQSLARQELQHHRPIIFEVPGHFLVGTGITIDVSDFYINDPAYLYTVLSQHQTPPVSMRTFYPSFTDLSYFMVVHTPGLEVTLRDETHQVVEDFDGFEEIIIGEGEGPTEQTPSLVQRLLPKPNNGKYSLELMSSALTQFELELYVYDSQANPYQFKNQGWIGTTPVTLNITFDKEGDTSVQKTTSWENVRLALKDLHQQKNIQTTHLYTRLDRLAAAAAAAPLSDQPRHLILIQHTLDHSTLPLSPSAYEYLTQLLLELKLTLP